MLLNRKLFTEGNEEEKKIPHKHRLGLLQAVGFAEGIMQKLATEVNVSGLIGRFIECHSPFMLYRPESLVTIRT
jgi:hypothetical protein